MRANSFDRYQSRTSLVHQLDPRLKVVVTVIFIVSNALLPDGAWLAFLASWILVLLASQLSALHPGYLIKRSFVALPFALAAVTVLFTLPGEPLTSWSWGGRLITISQAGVVRFASIVVRSWLSVQMAILLTTVTHFPDLMHALRHLRLPHILVAIISFMYRYLFVLADEAVRLLRAREARSARPSDGRGGGSLSWRARVAGGMVGQLFLRSIERSERVYNAMLARGYQGQLLTINPHQMSGRDWQVGLSTALLLLIIQLAGRLV